MVDFDYSIVDLLIKDGKSGNQTAFSVHYGCFAISLALLKQY